MESQLWIAPIVSLRLPLYLLLISLSFSLNLTSLFFFSLMVIVDAMVKLESNRNLVLLSQQWYQTSNCDDLHTFDVLGSNSYPFFEFEFGDGGKFD